MTFEDRYGLTSLPIYNGAKSSAIRYVLEFCAEAYDSDAIEAMKVD